MCTYIIETSAVSLSFFCPSGITLIRRDTLPVSQLYLVWGEFPIKADLGFIRPKAMRGPLEGSRSRFHPKKKPRPVTGGALQSQT
jgi:hypothetical protein